MTKSKAGRHTKMTDECISKLEEAFTWGCTDSEACCFADISMATLYRYCEKNTQFRDRKEKLKDMPVMKAKLIQFNELENDSISQANKVIDRKEGTKVNNTITGANGGPVQIAEVIFNPVGADD